jgi:predicted transposase YbfD/YdcC
MRSGLFPPQAETVEKAHGRLEIRRIWTSTELNGYVDFPFCGQVARIERITTRIRAGKIHHEKAAIITSLSPQEASPARLLQIVRGHWSIENRSHWVRDVTFDEDRSQVRTNQGPRMMAILRNLAIALIRLLGFEWVPQGLRHFAQRPRLVLNVLRL